MTIRIQASELSAAGFPPAQWKHLNLIQRARLASTVLRRRGDAPSRQSAFLLETNNPQALTSLSLIWDLRG